MGQVHRHNLRSTITSSGTTHLRYRPDIDGLRALAVLLVIADHWQTRLHGGFVGVDVFFVISGYLISAQIVGRIASHTFSIADFYERRIRRIAPAMLVMLAVVTLVVYHELIYDPPALESYGRSLLSAIASVSNIFFLHQTGYFGVANFTKPLLHTWSLAVEEQFYIFFPLLLLLLQRLVGNRFKQAILAASALSLVAAALIVRDHESAAFFLAPLRAWELLAGTILSQHYLPKIKHARAREAAALLGLLLIVVPAILYTDKTTFPGLTAIPPCLGACLLIAAGETGTSLVGRLLSLRPVVFVGAISYSLYLWHWPVWVLQYTFQLFVQGSILSFKVKAVLLVISFALGTLSWRFVEQPFRAGRFKPARKTLFVSSAAAALAIIAVGVFLLASHGAVHRLPADAQALTPYEDYETAALFHTGSCFLESEQSFADFQQSTCLPPGTARHPSVLLVGDSHAAHLYTALQQTFPAVTIGEAAIASCVPLLHVEPDAPRRCRDMSDFLYQNYLPQHHIDTLLLSARWHPVLLQRLGETLAWMHQHGINVVLVGPGMEYNSALPQLLVRSKLDHDPQNPQREQNLDMRALDHTMAQLAAQQWHVPYISVYQLICPAAPCPAYAAPGVPMLFDKDHFTAKGSLLFATRLREHTSLTPGAWSAPQHPPEPPVSTRQSPN